MFTLVSNQATPPPPPPVEGVDVGFRSEGERMAATLEKNLAKFKEGGNVTEPLGVGDKKTGG